MSKPVSNSEIEDVLSSIRRLVAESGRGPAQSGRQQAQGAAQGGPVLPEKLVLSPALRVPDDDPNDPDADEARDDDADVADADWSRESAAEDEDGQFLHERDAETADAAGDTRDQFNFRRDLDDADEIEIEDEDEDDAIEALERRDAAEDEDRGEDAVALIEGMVRQAHGASAEPEQAPALPDKGQSRPETSETGARAMLERLVRGEIAAVADALAEDQIAELEEDDTAEAEDDDWEPAEIASAPADIVDHDASEASEEEWETDGPASVQDEDALRVSAAPAQPSEHPASGDRMKVSLEQKIAELEAMIARSDEEWEGDDVAGGNAGFATILGEAQPWQDADLDDAVEHSDAAEVASSRNDELGADDLPPVLPRRVRQQDIDAPASPSRGSRPQAEPRERAPAPEPERRTEFTSTRAAAPAEASTGHRLDLAAALRQERVDMIDEDMLREMVSDIVRQELQGSLGERITRNVRKLVRREIQRALSGTEFD